jgi:hypothetical protein
MSDEQTSGQRVTTQEKQTSSDAWGDPISEERQAGLQGYLDRWKAETDRSASATGGQCMV